MEILAKGNKHNYIGVEMSAGAVRLYIEGYIGKWEEASVANIKKAITEAGTKADKAIIYINSEGGSVFEANEIVNIISRTFKEVRVEVGALAASAASYFLAKFPSEAKSNSQIMIHKPGMCSCGNIDKLQADAKLLANLTDQYAKDYTSKMDIKPEAFREKWQQDWWMTADEALQLGLIDRITEEPASMDPQTYERLVACGAPIQPQPTKTQNMDMQVMANLLGLPAGATDEEIRAKVTELQARASKAEELEKQIKEKAEAERQSAIKAMLDQAEREHKITAGMRAHYEKLAQTDFEGVKAILEEMKPMDQAPSASLKKGAQGERAQWTYADWAEKDPQGFDQLPEEEQKRIIDAYYEEED